MMRTFALLLAAGLAGPILMADETPLWKAGLMTDTHVGSSAESCARVKMACELFAREGVDLVANCGDIADHHNPKGYAELRKIYAACFTAKKPREIWVYAYHDHHGRQTEPFDTVMQDVQRLLGIPNAQYELIDFKGYPLVVLPQFWKREKAEPFLQEAVAKYPGKPIFVFDHVPPRATVDDSITWGAQNRHELYAKYPQVVQFSGHTHCTFRSELQIWQGAFTAVNVGCLQAWGGHAIGGAPEAKPDYGVLILDVYADRLVVRRLDVRDGSEYGANERWTIPLPFDPKTAPYRREVRVPNEPIPQFDAGAQLVAAVEGDPAKSVRFTIPEAQGLHGTYQYRIEVKDAVSGSCARQDVFGQFWKREGERTPASTVSLSAGYFALGHPSQIVVTPVNCYGVGGKPLTTTITVARRVGRTIWESDKPMADCGFYRYLKGGARKPVKEGWLEMHAGDNRLELPAGIWTGDKNSRWRFTVDMEMEQNPKASTWTIVLRNPDPVINTNARVATPPGKSGPFRLVLEFAKRRADDNYYLLVREGGAGRIRFNHIKVERIDE